MTGSALKALKLAIRHDELENVNRVLLDALVEVSGTQILFHWIGLKKLPSIHMRNMALFEH